MTAPAPREASEPPAGKPPAVDLTGRTLGDFRILRRLGEGGMGQVYLAEQVSLHRKVALKLLRPELAANPVTRQRFRIEAEAAARATHANIVQVYAIGEAEGWHYIALEYVEGRTLRDFLEKKGPPDLLLALSIMRQVAAALQRAHELGVIHRDIKPENILLTRRGEVKVADFGLSRIYAADRRSPCLTQSQIVMGTPLYMSPEQIENREIDSRADIYSFGVTCYHMLAGRPPFHGQTAFEVVVQHVRSEPPPLASLRPDLPPELCQLIHRMMAKRPEDRPQTGREIAREVAHLLDRLRGAPPQPEPVITQGPVPAAPTDVVQTVSLQAVSGYRWLLFGSLLLASVLGGVLGWLQRPGPAATVDVSPTASSSPTAAQENKREEFLRDALRQYADSDDKEQQLFRLRLALELGLLYLREGRLDEAEQFFKEIKSHGKDSHKPAPRWLENANNNLSLIGQALVLAYRDQPRESNALLLKLYRAWQSQQHPNAPKGFWFHNPQMRQAIAEALNRNYLNAPQDFPPELEALRQLPQPARLEGKTPPGKRK
jgi:tRNA A-37 threonylcarbamoyl transferase component Bud32